MVIWVQLIDNWEIWNKQTILFECINYWKSILKKVGFYSSKLDELSSFKKSMMNFLKIQYTEDKKERVMLCVWKLKNWEINLLNAIKWVI